MMTNQVLSAKQMQHLKELGLKLKQCEYLPAYTLEDMLNILLTSGYKIRVGYSDGVHYFAAIFNDHQPLYYSDDDKLIDAVYGLLCMAIERGHVETKKVTKT